MSSPSKPDLAKLLIGVFTKDKNLFPIIAKELSEKFGTADIVSSWMPFNYTDYYEPEMGESLMRRMLSFEKRIEQDELVEIKLITNELEKKYLCEGKRIANIDPGYMLKSRFVLATGKDFTHRVYIGRGIYADLTLIFKGGTFQTLPWTYPDYADNIMLSYLTGVRNKYIGDMNNNR